MLKLTTDNLNWRIILISLISLPLWALADISLDSNIVINCMTVDAKGNYYIADQKNTLYKYDKSGNLITRVNSKLYGTVYSIDCSNPFELYVHYKDQNKVVFLDNMLNQRGELDLSSFGYGNISAIARTFDNQLWLFNATEFELMKVSKAGEILSRSGQLSAFVSSGLSPYSIKESGNQVYLADSSAGILIFDMFATYSKTVALYGSTAFDVNGNQLLLQKSNHSVFIYNMRSFTSNTIAIPSDHKLRDLAFKPEGLAYALNHQIIEIQFR